MNVKLVNWLQKCLSANFSLVFLSLAFFFITQRKNIFKQKDSYILYTVLQ